jgi:Tfp pilus assembly protein PilO
MAVNFNAILDEFKRTNWKDPGTWHAVPKTVVLLAILVAIPVAGYFGDTASQIE